MTDLRKAVEQALDALEQLQGGCTDSGDGTVEAITVWCPEIITALREALAKPAVPDGWEISTEHGPWKQSHHEEHETYCARCHVRDVFRTHRRCEPHIVAASLKPKDKP